MILLANILFVVLYILCNGTVDRMALIHFPLSLVMVLKITDYTYRKFFFLCDLKRNVKIMNPEFGNLSSNEYYSVGAKMKYDMKPILWKPVIAETKFE